MIWVEILSRNHDVTARHAFDVTNRDRITIGRAYDNDVVIDDPYVAPHHVALVRSTVDDAEAWVAEDAGSLNGMFIDRVKRKQSRVTVADDRIMHIGRSSFRVRSSATRVAPERAMPTPGHGWKLAIAFLIALIAIEIASTWLGEITEPKLSRYLFLLLGLASVLLIWTTIWSVLCRVFSGFAKFDRHLLIATGGVLLLSILNEFTRYGAYAFSLPMLSGYEYIATWLVAGGILFFHLREISPQHWRLKSAIVSIVAAVGIGSTWLSQIEAQKIAGKAQFLREMQPPTLQIVPSQTQDAFFAEAEALKPKLDKARTEEKPEASLFGAFDFDD
jgi:hypothetical protein